MTTQTYTYNILLAVSHTLIPDAMSLFSTPLMIHELGQHGPNYN